MSDNRAWGSLKRALSQFGADEVIVLSAAMAFFAMLSLAPLLVLLLTVAGWLGEGTQKQIVDRTQSMIGPQAGEMVQTVIANVEAQQVQASASAILGIAATLLAATGAFVHLQRSLNRIFNVRAKGGSATTWLWKRFLSLLMILGIGAVLVTSMIVSSVITVVFPQGGLVWEIVNIVVSLAILILAFMVMFKVLPDVELTWHDTLTGGIITGVLFFAGSYAIGKYLGHTGTGSAFGAAGSLAILLVWMFYSAIIIFFGAELTYAYITQRGRRLEPDRFAERTERVAAQEGPKREHAETHSA